MTDYAEVFDDIFANCDVLLSSLRQTEGYCSYDFLALMIDCQ